MLVRGVVYCTVTSVPAWVTLTMYSTICPLCSASGGGFQDKYIEYGVDEEPVRSRGNPLGTVKSNTINLFNSSCLTYHPLVVRW